MHQYVAYQNQTVRCMFILIRAPSHFLSADFTQAWLGSGTAKYTVVPLTRMKTWKSDGVLSSYRRRESFQSALGRQGARLCTSRPASCREFWNIRSCGRKIYFAWQNGSHRYKCYVHVLCLTNGNELLLRYCYSIGRCWYVMDWMYKVYFRR